MKVVGDGRLQDFKLESVIKAQPQNSLLLQGIETYDEQLLDWCLDNMQPPTELPVDYIPHILDFLSGKFWVFSDATALEWIKSILKSNRVKIQTHEETQKVLVDVRAKLTAKTESMPDVHSLRDKLSLVLHQRDTQVDIEIEETPELVIT